MCKAKLLRRLLERSFPSWAGKNSGGLYRKPPSSLSSWETYQRGLWHFHKLTPAENLRARRLFAEAAEIDPGFASPRVGLSQTYLFDCLGTTSCLRR